MGRKIGYVIDNFVPKKFSAGVDFFFYNGEILVNFYRRFVVFIEILALIFGGALMGVGVYLIKGKAKIKKCHTYSFRLGSCLYILGLSIFASCNFDDHLRDRLPDVFKYVSLNSFWSILWAGLGLSFVLDDLKKRENIDSSSKEDVNQEEKSNAQKDK